jgi:hypothetical protein
MPTHTCEVVVAQFVWGVTRCGIDTRRQIKDDHGQKRWVCSIHRTDQKKHRFSNQAGRNRP